MESGLFLREHDGGQLYRRLVSPEGVVILEDVISPHQTLIGFLDHALPTYTHAFHSLESHPFFNEELDVSYLELQDLIAQSEALADTLRVDDPVAHFFSKEQIQQAITLPDDGSAGIWLTRGQLALHGAGIRYTTRVQLENIMEICFGTSSELTQNQRYHKAMSTYPELSHHHFSARWVEDEQGRLVQEYQIYSLLEFYWFCVVQALRSPKRICRCQHCWRYFVPKTQKKTVYCDRLNEENKSCKDLGAHLKRQLTQREDPYLQWFQRLQKRFYERTYRGYANPKELDLDYPTWIEQASKARSDYLNGKIDGETFLALISSGEELQLVAPTPLESTSPLLTAPWESLVAGDLNFDPATHFQDIQFLDLGASNPAWEIVTAEESQRKSKGGNVSLQEKSNI